jgi:hypothetical protein
VPASLLQHTMVASQLTEPVILAQVVAVPSASLSSPQKKLTAAAGGDQVVRVGHGRRAAVRRAAAALDRLRVEHGRRGRRARGRGRGRAACLGAGDGDDGDDEGAGEVHFGWLDGWLGLGSRVLKMGRLDEDEMMGVMMALGAGPLRFYTRP